MKKNSHRNIIVAIATLIPTLAFAAPLSGVISLIGDFSQIMALVKPLVFGLAFIYFFWGMGQFILKDAGNEKSREEGKKKMLWSVIALFVMFSIMGIISFISATFLGNSSSGIPNVNDIPIGTTGQIPGSIAPVDVDVTIPIDCGPDSIDGNC